jgi:Zn-finger nucleic acid-binding protein
MGEVVMRNIEQIDNLGILIIDEVNSKETTVEIAEADFETCPICKGTNISYGETEPESLFIYRIHTCNNCNTSWEERYDLVKLRIIKG